MNFDNLVFFKRFFDLQDWSRHDHPRQAVHLLSMFLHLREKKSDFGAPSDIIQYLIRCKGFSTNITKVIVDALIGLRLGGEGGDLDTGKGVLTHLDIRNRKYGMAILD